MSILYFDRKCFKLWLEIWALDDKVQKKTVEDRNGC